MPFKIYNTLTRQLEEFVPIKKNKVRMYNCGPTVYKKAHIGNLVPYIFADVLRRTLEFNGYRVKQVINITDVGHLVSDNDSGEDKVEVEAKKRGLKAKSITDEITKLFFEDLYKLNIETKKIIFPRATKYIKEQIKLIRQLEKKGYTYIIDDGVYFDTSIFNKYGALGQINLENLKVGARVEMNPQKRNLTDFALWKFSNPNQKREQEWPSPWGIGFPGWHIECSAMSQKLLGQPFDIHTGGIDHISVHHNNEIAQSECAFGRPLSNYWMHVNHILLNNQKISKSLNNEIFINDLIQKGIWPSSYRMLLASSHYSSSLNYTDEAILGAHNSLKKVINTFQKTKKGKVSKDYLAKFLEAMNDNLNTPIALSIFWEVYRNTELPAEDRYATILEMDKIFGFDIKGLVRKQGKIKIPAEIIELAKKRQEARDAKNWAKSDELRLEIEKNGFTVKDHESGFDISPI